MATLLLRLCASVRSIWRALRREMGSQFAFPENQPDRPFTEGVVGFFFERLKGMGFSCASFGHFISFSFQPSAFSDQPCYQCFAEC
jgi:hypothetical protein